MEDATAAPAISPGLRGRRADRSGGLFLALGSRRAGCPGHRVGMASFTILDIDRATVRGYVLPTPMLSESDSHAVGRLTCRPIRPTVPA